MSVTNDVITPEFDNMFKTVMRTSNAMAEAMMRAGVTDDLAVAKEQASLLNAIGQAFIRRYIEWRCEAMREIGDLKAQLAQYKVQMSY